MRRLPVAGPWITQKEIDYVTDATTNAWYEDANVYHRRFERAFAEYLGVRHAVALPSCTSALHLALLALGVGPGDEVIVPDVTWIATAAPIVYVGATPVFADVDRKTWCLSVDAFEACITPQTRAVIPVDLYGGLPDWDSLLEVAGRHGVAVVEDAAEAAGGEYKSKKAGSFGDAGTFSFHGSKTLTTGEGGMFVTDRDDLYERILVLRDHGRQPGDKMFWNHEVAYKYKMSAMQAALGLAQLERIDELIDRKRETFLWYKAELAGIDGVELNHEPRDVKNVYWMVSAIVDPSYGVTKEELMRRLDAEGVDTRPFFHPLSAIPAFADTEQARVARERNVTAQEICPYGINLPSNLRLTRDDVTDVCDALKRCLGLDVRS